MPSRDVLSDVLSEEVDSFVRRKFDVVGVVVAIGRFAGGTSGTQIVSGPSAPEADEDTLFEVGSLTKPITAMILASLVRGGDVALEMPISELLADGVRAPSKDGRQITLLDLATHRSGLPRLPPNLGWSALVSDDPYKNYTREKLLQCVDKNPLRTTPGKKFEYSNLGYGLLGTLLADRRDTSYAQLAREHVFAPLGMTRTRADYADDFRLIRGHSIRGSPCNPWHLGSLEGAGVVRSSVRDMLRFVEMNLLASTTPANASPLAKILAVTHTPRLDAAGDNRIGLAWLTTPRGNVWHNGGTGGYRSFMGFSPERGEAVVVLANLATGAVDTLGWHLLDARNSL
jgi:CubicO group peptidase (beta-lactamase class C family)